MTTTAYSDCDVKGVFNYKWLRAIMGVIAFSLPFVTDGVSSRRLASISASYYTEGHDAFFGMLLVIATLLLAYNGCSPWEKISSKIASIATVLVAVFPTNCEGCGVDLKSSIHYGSAFVVFATLIYFCFGPFRTRAKSKGEMGKRRAFWYTVFGSVMTASLLFAVIMQFTRPADQVITSRITYWTETISLVTFGAAWIVAGQVFPPLAAKEERPKLSLK
jgi:hypothetical protein